MEMLTLFGSGPQKKGYRDCITTLPYNKQVQNLSFSWYLKG